MKKKHSSDERRHSAGTFLHPSLVRLRPRNHLHYISHSRIVWAINRAGVAEGAPEEGLFFSDTRLLSHYKYFVNGTPPNPVALSAIDQHSWMGYYIFFPPGHPEGEADTGSGMVRKASEQTVEMRVFRKVLSTVTEKIEFTNHTQAPTQFAFDIELESDFTDLSETKQVRKQKGRTSKRFLSGDSFTYEVKYRASHKKRTIERGFRLSGKFFDARDASQKQNLHQNFSGTSSFLGRINRMDSPNRIAECSNRLFGIGASCQALL